MSDVIMPIGFDRPPDNVGPTGVKWWVDHTTTKYARREVNGKPSPLAKVVAWLVLETNGTMTRVLTEENEYLFESQQLEAIGAHIDILRLAREDD